MEASFKKLQTNNREIEERFSDFTQHNESVFNQSIADLKTHLGFKFKHSIVQNVISLLNQNED